MPYRKGLDQGQGSMDDFEKTFKRLAIIFIASLVVIFIAKSMLSKAANNVGKAAVVKKQREAVKAAEQAVAASAATADVAPIVPPVNTDMTAAPNVAAGAASVAESAPAGESTVGSVQ